MAQFGYDSAVQHALELLERARTLASQGKITAALSAYTEIVETPDVPLEIKACAWAHRGLLHGQRGACAQAIRDWSAALETDAVPPDWRAHLLVERGRMYAAQGAYPEALHDFATVLQMPDAPAEERAKALLARGLAFVQQDDLTQAIHDMTAVLEMPDAPAEWKARTLVNRSAVFMQQNDWHQSLADLDAVFAMPDAPPDAIQQATMMRALHQAAFLWGASTDTEDDAQLPAPPSDTSDHSKVTRMPDAPDNLEAAARIAWGEMLMASNQFEDALADFAYVLTLKDIEDTLRARAHIYCARLYARLDDYEQARAHYTEALKFADADTEPVVRFERGSSCLALDDLAQAMEDFTAVIERDDAPAEVRLYALLGRGRIHAKQGDLDAAAVDYLTASGLEGVSEEAQRAARTMLVGLVFGIV